MAPFSPREREQREKRQLQAVRDKFFKGADSSQVSDERAFRRLTQDRAEQNFKDRFTKGVEGSSNLLQMTQDAPRSLAAERERLANLYGPTPGELAGDFARGLGSIVGGVSDRVMSGSFGLFGLAKDLYNKATGALRSGVDKLSSVDLEILKNKDKYNFVSNKPKLQGIQQLEVDAKLAANLERNAGIIAANRNLFGDYSEFGGPVSMQTAEVEELDPIIAPKAEPTTQEVETIRGPFISTDVGVGAGPTTFDRTIGVVERDPQTLQDTVIESFRNPSPGLQRALAGPSFTQQEDQKILDFLKQTKRLYEGGIVSSRR
jgi:hypothetical protein